MWHAGLMRRNRASQFCGCGWMGRDGAAFEPKTPLVSAEVVVLREVRWFERELLLGRAPLM